MKIRMSGQRAYVDVSSVDDEIRPTVELDRVMRHARYVEAVGEDGRALVLKDVGGFTTKQVLSKSTEGTLRLPHEHESESLREAREEFAEAMANARTRGQK